MLPALSRMPETPRPHAARSSGTGNSRGSLSGHGHANVRRIDLVALALLTAAGFALRLVGMDSSLFGDERYTYSIVDGHGLGTVWHDVFTTSITPPLHYALAWVSLQWGGDSTVLVRLPSLVLGTAAIPVVFLLGRRVAGTRVGLFAAAILALSPFAIFYSTEARAYATMVFLVGLSTLALLEAVGRGRTAWWVIYTLSSCAAIWAHYTAAFVLATQALWAVLARPDRWRTVAVAQVVIALGYLPWLPGFLEQRRNRGVEAFDSLTTFDVSSVAEYPIRSVVGHPFRELDAIPGRTGLVLMLAVLLTATFAAAVTVRQGSGLPRAAAALRSERGLMVLLSAATLLGLLLYDAVGPRLFVLRNVSASQPALVVVLALVLADVTRRLPVAPRRAATGLMLSLLAVTAVQSVGSANQRPAYRDAANYIDAVGGTDVIVEEPLVFGPDARLGRSTLSLYLRKSHRLVAAGQDADVWRRERAGASVIEVSPQQFGGTADVGRAVSAALRARMSLLGGPDGRSLRRSTKTFPRVLPAHG